MRRLLIACSFGLALASTASFPAAADYSYHSTLDDGRPIGGDWSVTEGFDEITFAGNDDLVLTRGEQWRIRAIGNPEVLAELRFRIEDGKLVVGRKSSRRPVPGTARIEVTAPGIAGATLAGSGTLDIDMMRGDAIRTTLAGSGTFAVERLDTPRLDATVAGSGDLRLGGRAAEGRISIAGSGDFDGAGLRMGRAAVSIAGSGDARFHADRDVSASIVGSGDVTVTGTTDCTQSRMGSGRLRCSR